MAAKLTESEKSLETVHAQVESFKEHAAHAETKKADYEKLVPKTSLLFAFFEDFLPRFRSASRSSSLLFFLRSLGISLVPPMTSQKVDIILLFEIA